MRRLLALVLLVQALNVGVANAAAKNLVLVVTDPYLEMRSGPGRGFPIIYVIGRDELSRCSTAAPTGSRCARCTATRAGCGAPIWRARWRSRAIRRRYRPTLILPRIAGSWRRVRRLQPRESGHGLCRFWADDSLDVEFVAQQAFGTLDNRYVASIGVRHTFIPEWKWFSPTAGIGAGYQYLQDKVPPAPLQKSNEMAYVSLAHADSSPGGSCGASIGATMSSSITRTCTRI